MVTCRATLDVPKELVRYLARILRAHRRALDARANNRALTCYNQAILVLRHFRDRTDTNRLATDHGISRATVYRYVDEGITVLADQPQTSTKPWDRPKTTDWTTSSWTESSSPPIAARKRPPASKMSR